MKNHLSRPLLISICLACLLPLACRASARQPRQPVSSPAAPTSAQATQAAALPTQAFAQPTAAPQATSSSIPTENLRLAAEYNAANDGISMLVMQNGQVIFEDYPNGGRADRPHELASGTKSFNCAIAVAAAADGLLDLDERASDTLTEWQNDPAKAYITIRQLLSLTSGLQTGGENGRVPSYAEAIQAPLVDEPGSKFTYGAVPFQVFGEIMRRKLQPSGQSPLDYLEARVFDPIGLQVGRWRKDADGNPHLPSGAFLTARQWAKYGELVRLGGSWQGQTLLPYDLLEQCFQGTPANPAYGLTWWLNAEVAPELRAAIPQLTAATDVTWGVPGIPEDLVFAAGAGKQRMYVSRQLNLVVVRQAEGILASLTGLQRSQFSDAQFLRVLLAGQP
ncbi:MAG: serine hydrolase [Chloroflexota bacterium]